jgi:hypothetical protein
LEKVWAGFDQEIGATVNLNVWIQERFTEVARDGRIVLMPTRVTGDIFNQLAVCYEKGEEITKKRFVIAGEKGTGKSYSYLMYDYLSKFMLAYRMA